MNHERNSDEPVRSMLHLNASFITVRRYTSDLWIYCLDIQNIQLILKPEEMDSSDFISQQDFQCLMTDCTDA